MIKKYLWFVTAVLFVIAGCSMQTSSPTETEPIIETRLPDPQATKSIEHPGPTKIETSPVEAYPVLPTEGASLSPYPEPGESVSSGTVESAPVKEDLMATDPVLVDFASGKPTFVEFFAFW